MADTKAKAGIHRAFGFLGRRFGYAAEKPIRKE